MILSLLLAGMGTAATAQNINLPIIQTKYTADPAPYVHNDTVYLLSLIHILKCEVLDESKNVLGSQIIQCTKNVNKNTGANTYGSNSGKVRL